MLDCVKCVEKMFANEGSGWLAYCFLDEDINEFLKLIKKYGVEKTSKVFITTAQKVGKNIDHDFYNNYFEYLNSWFDWNDFEEIEKII